MRSERGLSMAIQHVDKSLHQVNESSEQTQALATGFGQSATTMADAAQRMSAALGGAEQAAEYGVHALDDLNAKADARNNFV